MTYFSQAQSTSALLTLFVLVLVVRRTLGTQTVSVFSLLLIPVLIIVIAAAAIVATPHGPASAVAVGGGALAGAALGYARGLHSHVRLGPRPNTLVVKGSPLLVAVILGAFAVRFGIRTYFASDAHAALAVGNGVLAFAAVSVSVARAMLFLAWRRLAAPAPAPL